MSPARRTTTGARKRPARAKPAAAATPGLAGPATVPRPYTIVHLTAEYAPYARTGGLAEAVMGLATFQARAGWPVVVFLPLYRSVRERADELALMGRGYDVWIGGRREEVRFFREVASRGGPRVVFVDQPEYFNRAGLYGDQGRDFRDNHRRFAFFARACLEGIPRLIPGKALIHCHDWHTALAPAYVRTYPFLRDRFVGTPLVMSVHNAGYQGHFPSWVMDDVGLPWEHWNFRELEWHGQLNYLKAGLVYSHAAVTVSPNHATELRTPSGGFGLDAVFRALGPRFGGICNGIDQQVWDPRHDPEITATYGPDDLAGKERCKTALQRSFGLPQRKRVPLFAMTGRLVTQKGMEILLRSRHLWTLDAQFIFLGAGEPRFEDALLRAARQRPQHIAVEFGWTERLEHRLMAGADVFLMPSQYEPCGLTQMRAQRYGTPVVGRRVGGIADTVTDDVTGFLFDAYDAAALDWAIERALARMADPAGWAARQRAAMARDFGWETAAERYFDLYAMADRLAAR